MQKCKTLIAFIVGSIFFAGIAYAAPSVTYHKNLLPEVTDTYDLGSAALEWGNGYFNNMTVTGTCTGCGSGTGTGTGGVSGGTAGMLTSWTSSSALTATSTPTATAYFATSTTATSTFMGKFFVGTTSSTYGFTPGITLGLNKNLILSSDRDTNNFRGNIQFFNTSSTTKTGLEWYDYLGNSVAWLVNHYNNPGALATDHTHIELETSDLSGNKQGRFTVGYNCDYNCLITMNQGEFQLNRNSGQTNGNMLFNGGGQLRNTDVMQVIPNNAINTKGFRIATSSDNDIQIDVTSGTELEVADNINLTGSQYISANLGVGTTSPLRQLTLEKSGAAGTTAGPQIALRQNQGSINATTNTTLGEIIFEGADVFGAEEGIGAKIRAQASSFWNNITNDYPTDLLFFTQPDGGATGLTERMRITHNGIVGVASSSPTTEGGTVLAVNGTTTIMGRVMHVGPTTCGSGGLMANTLQGIEFCGDEPNVLAGVEGIIDNNNAGTGAWSGLVLNNNLADNSLTHFAGSFYNSSTYNDATFGSATAIPNLLLMQNTDGPMTFFTGTTTDNNNTSLYMAWNTGSTNTDHERMRLTSTGNFGIATTAPTSRFAVAGNSFFGGNLIATGTLTLTPLGTPAGKILAVDPSGNVIATTTSAGGVASVNGTYPVQSTGGVNPAISLAFGTTTANIWSGLQAFTNVGTTTFAGGVDFTRFNLSATSTGSKGIDLSGGCFAINGTCISGGGGSSASSTLLTDNNTYSGTSTFANDALFKYVKVGTSTCASTIRTLLDVCGNDNTTAGVQAGLSNPNNGSSAYSFFYFNNGTTAAEDNATHYGGFQFNGRNYADTTFGTAIAVPEQLSMWATDGPLTYIAASSTSNNSYINFLTAGPNTSNERMRIASNGAVSIGSTTPFLTNSLTLGSTTPVIADVYLPATSTSMKIGMATGTVQQIDTGTSAYTLTVSAYKIAPGQSKRVYSCNPGMAAGNTLTWAADAGVHLSFPAGVAPSNTTAAGTCDQWFLDVIQPFASTTPWVLISQGPAFN